MNASCDSSMLSRNLSQNQRPFIFEGQEIDETLSQDYIDPLVWKTGHSTAPESCHENDIVVSLKCLPLPIFSTRLLRTAAR